MTNENRSTDTSVNERIRDARPNSQRTRISVLRSSRRSIDSQVAEVPGSLFKFHSHRKINRNENPIYQTLISTCLRLSNQLSHFTSPAEANPRRRNSSHREGPRNQNLPRGAQQLSVEVQSFSLDNENWKIGATASVR